MCYLIHIFVDVDVFYNEPQPDPFGSHDLEVEPCFPGSGGFAIADSLQPVLRLVDQYL